MLDKLKSLISPEPERGEFKPRKQGLREKSVDSSNTEVAPGEHKSDGEGRGVLIGYDYLKMKSEVGQDERIQSKMELLRQLQKELGLNGKVK